MSEPSLEEVILERLRGVIDPETQTEVVRMRLVENLWQMHSAKYAIRSDRLRLFARSPFLWQWTSRIPWQKCPA